MGSGAYKARKATAGAKVSVIADHIHSVAMVYPDLDDSITVTAEDDVTTWTLGPLVEIVPADTITEPFDIHFLFIASISNNSEYQLNLYQGAGDELIAEIPFTREGVQDGAVRPLVVMTPMIPAGARIRAALASAADNGETVTIKVGYHTY